ncbi:hypothetical protein CIG75_07260 [Tumebacillus algifaecis]|uniref:NgoFVII family restriction endonuclease n=1 Tax=Tumebacillus algifaecis TaxID=1214604 RepID=A0A223D086_9BACL|nr:restriction endonuclease PLD domain-containing protein [Tumebacillus algifaecis]ASS74794.1 hypothetical protein CIG75_07260 [Tumebacillus algifaecis]
MVLWPNLFNDVIQSPYSEGYRNLKVLTGYSSSAFVKHILEQFDGLSLELTIGMSRTQPIPIWEHNEYVRMTNEYGRLQVNYFIGTPPIHVKALIWSDFEGMIAFAGSANFTWNGFRGYQEMMVPTNAEHVLEAFPPQHLSINCTDPSVFDHLQMSYQRNPRTTEIDVKSVESILLTDRPSVELPLLITRGRRREVHSRSGLNWGQRDGREPNQAYLPVPRTAHFIHTDFFPPRGREFTMITDDGQSFVCVMAQGDEGLEKAIHTTRNNSIFGKYFRNRLAVNLGAKVRTEDLLAYGRTSVALYKIDEETYFLDYCRPEQ